MEHSILLAQLDKQIDTLANEVGGDMSFYSNQQTFPKENTSNQSLQKSKDHLSTADESFIQVTASKDDVTAMSQEYNGLSMSNDKESNGLSMSNDKYGLPNSMSNDKYGLPNSMSNDKYELPNSMSNDKYEGSMSSLDVRPLDGMQGKIHDMHGI
jgi:hypothetical protein